MTNRDIINADLGRARRRKGAVWVVLFIAVPIWLCSGAAAQADGLYFRAGGGVDWSEETRFKDKDCSGRARLALYGCGAGIDGAPLSSLGDFGVLGNYELGAGYGVADALRLEAVFQHRPSFSFKGRANFVQTRGRQETSADMSSLAGMLAAYVDLPRLGLPKLGPFSPFIGGGVGISHTDINKTRMRFTKTATIVPGGQELNFAWMLTAGVGTPLTEKITLDVAYRYTDSGTVETDNGIARVVNQAGTTLVPLDIGKTRGHLASHGLHLSLRYTF